MNWNLKVALKFKDLKHNSPGGTNQKKKNEYECRCILISYRDYRQELMNRTKLKPKSILKWFVKNKKLFSTNQSNI